MLTWMPKGIHYRKVPYHLPLCQNTFLYTFEVLELTGRQQQDFSSPRFQCGNSQNCHILLRVMRVKSHRLTQMFIVGVSFLSFPSASSSRAETKTGCTLIHEWCNYFLPSPLGSIINPLHQTGKWRKICKSVLQPSVGNPVTGLTIAFGAQFFPPSGIQSGNDGFRRIA
ncbi:hypothetical protein EV356DRAFT_331716 [Viridothelium virens]|uniref:Uncharacterized protein n=1 Tax=Viridothelium virens TaxID=1048519 RepID=A0A6A6HJG1_VIRVR|nr:hypothetical protein EV356DRAFT_331716 [Viridothelium virens]